LTRKDKILLNKLSKYIDETETPILCEFCAENKILEDYFYLHEDEAEAKRILKLLEQKKRASLERKIYEGKLNATVGTHLIKSWHEKNPEKITEAESTSKTKFKKYRVKDKDSYTCY
jgi:hypothetical protein